MSKVVRLIVKFGSMLASLMMAPMSAATGPPAIASGNHGFRVRPVGMKLSPPSDSARLK
jgi:hypothetical protein